MPHSFVDDEWLEDHPTRIVQCTLRFDCPDHLAMMQVDREVQQEIRELQSDDARVRALEEQPDARIHRNAMLRLFLVDSRTMDQMQYSNECWQGCLHSNE